jgi:hypothetical protein
VAGDKEKTGRAQGLIDLGGDCGTVTGVTVEPGRQIDDGNSRGHGIGPSGEDPFRHQ